MTHLRSKPLVQEKYCTEREKKLYFYTPREKTGKTPDLNGRIDVGAKNEAECGKTAKKRWWGRTTRKEISKKTVRRPGVE